MAFTAPVITHTFTNATGTSASGTVTFTLLNRMTNGTKTIIPGTISPTLSSTGALSQAVTSNLDAGTVPNDTMWRVDQRIAGDVSIQSFSIVVPPIVTETNGTTVNGSPTVTLSSTTASRMMVGQSITGTGIPSGSVITAWDSTTNQVTISNNATASGTGVELVIGTTIDLGYLLPGNQQYG